MKNTNMPTHIAIIPDGNRRWAKERGLSTHEGHRAGFDALIKISRKSRNMGIRVMTIWAFSTENWKRSDEEVSYLMDLYSIMIDRYLKEAIKNEIRIIHLGRKDRISNKLRNKISAAEEDTKNFNKYYLAIALDYGGRDEIIRAIRKNKINNEEELNRALDTSSLPNSDPDLIIRTGGEKRLSGYLIWQSQYSELEFVDKYLPDYTPEDFARTINEYAKRNRRFGK